MDQTTEENGLSNKLSGRRSKDTIRDITASLRVIPGGLQRHQKHSRQQAQVRRFTTVLNTTAALFAHEVASPLQGMSASLQLMESGLQTNHDAVLTMRTFRREVDRLIILLNEFRSASVPRSLNLKSSDIRKVVQEALAIQLIVYRNAGVNVGFDFEDGLPTVEFDVSKIKQVILNLCKNALDAMPQGGDLNIRCYSLGASVILEIADTGIGMPAGLDPFTLFKTTKLSGSGLGLPIVEQIVLAHNGTIEYTSEPGRGTTFKIVLPRRFR
jgi:two-component system, NtrC family, sensor histidine kinase HydH